MTFSNAEKMILRRMLFSRQSGERHTAIENLAKGVPSHMRGEMKDAANDLIRKGYIVPKTTNYGRQVALNQNRIQELEKMFAGD